MIGLRKDRRGIGTPEYILILALALGLALLLFGKTILRALGERIEGISSGVQSPDKKEIDATTKKNGSPGEAGEKTGWHPFDNGGGAAGGSTSMPVDSGTFKMR